MRGSDSNKDSAKRNVRVVLTGKRVSGTWSMESKLEPKIARSSINQNVVVSENRCVRTLH